MLLHLRTICLYRWSNFMVYESTMKTTKIGPLKNFPLYSNFIDGTGLYWLTLKGTEIQTITIYTFSMCGRFLEFMHSAYLSHRHSRKQL